MSIFFFKTNMLRTLLILCWYSGFKGGDFLVLLKKLFTFCWCSFLMCIHIFLCTTYFFFISSIGVQVVSYPCIHKCAPLSQDSLKFISKNAMNLKNSNNFSVDFHESDMFVYLSYLVTHRKILWI